LLLTSHILTDSVITRLIVRYLVITELATTYGTLPLSKDAPWLMHQDKHLQAGSSAQ